jgi:hypothetical protein
MRFDYLRFEPPKTLGPRLPVFVNSSSMSTLVPCLLIAAINSTLVIALCFPVGPL